MTRRNQITFLRQTLRTWICETFRMGVLHPDSGNLQISNPLAHWLTSTMQKASNQFGFNFLRNAILNEPSKNQFLSPFSIESVLLMVLEGARGETSVEIGTALAFPAQLKDTNVSSWQLESIRNELQTLVQQFHCKSSDEHSCQLLSANGTWVDQAFALRHDFWSLMRQWYDAKIELVDFRNNAEGERIKINRWISDRTQQEINDLITPTGVSSETQIVLANAIYFRGTWQHAFDTSKTLPRTFYNLGVNPVTVPTMSKLTVGSRFAAFHKDGTAFEVSESLPPGSHHGKGDSQKGFQLLELGYQGGDISMWIALPAERNGLAALVERLSRDNFELWESALQPRDVLVSLPTFRIEVDYDLRGHLERLGMKAAFHPETADFSGMSESKLFISKVIHRSVLHVNEKGTEATAASVVMTKPTSAAVPTPCNLKFVVEHPFLIIIRHHPTGVNLFMGLIQHL